MTTQNLIARAASAFGRRDFNSAERDCRAVLATEPGNADARHLLGLVRRQAGDAAGAEPLLRSSIELRPRNAEFRVNFSNLLSAQGRLRDAEAELRTALDIEPGSRTARLALSRLLNKGGAHEPAESEARQLVERDARDAEAWAEVANAQRDQGQLGEAEGSFRRALAVRPDFAIARHNLGALLSRLKRAEESLRELNRAAELGVSGPELQANLGCALMALGRFDDADAALTSAITQAPESVESQILLAKLRYMRGEQNYTRDLAAAATGSTSPALSMALGDLLRRAGDLKAARSVLSAVVQQYPDSPAVRSSLAVLLQEQGQLDDALAHARAACEARPEDADITENLVAILLQSGEADEPGPLISRERQRTPYDQRWLAYEATAARLAGDSRYEDLYDYDRFVRSFDLEPPAGYASIGDFNAELGRRLGGLHQLETHPLDQSLRHGTQTPRDLLPEPDPVIQAFIAALASPLQAYCQAIGVDPKHPFLARNVNKTRLTGCWSVRLKQGGYHVNHIHPEGWISSAYYVEVPGEVADTDSKSGWIKFGEPRMPSPGAVPEHFVQPRGGRLVLFPSYMWHGTNPIHGSEPRLTLAFDARPQGDDPVVAKT